MLRRKKKETQHEAAGFTEEPGVGPERRRLTPTDVQEKVFRLSFRGYNEQDVDRFLDEVTEELASLYEENKRLREGAEDGGGMASTEILKEAERRAGETVRQAREYAARLMEDAGKRTTEGVTAVAAATAPSSFLIRERDFLQRLASLIQEHAEAVKTQARGSKPAESPKVELPPSPPTMPEEPVAVVPSAPMGETASTSETTQAHEPFLDDWEGTFSSGSEEQPFAETTSDMFPERAESKEGERGKDREEEPSLRELFWGEE
ncbi:MAG TPA: DivIVA domain-containing protein [Actinomycetota bacterium]|nr:DivIVA domain-containing protein [Actinomycetota bacterium]